jgi:GMP synthase (glutamine-hydrolysing)
MGSQTSATPIRLAILEADTPLTQTKAKFSSYGGVFANLFTRAAAPAPLESVLSISYYDIVGSSATYPSLDEIDAILITGSKHNAFEDGEGNWIANLAEFVRKALESERRVRVVGVCFGHQVVARALGVPVGRNAHGWEVSVTDVRLTEKGKEIFGRDTLVSCYAVGLLPRRMGVRSKDGMLTGYRKSTRCTATR